VQRCRHGAQLGARHGRALQRHPVVAFEHLRGSGRYAWEQVGGREPHVERAEQARAASGAHRKVPVGHRPSLTLIRPGEQRQQQASMPCERRVRSGHGEEA
jgi:hypothetical protein